MFFFTNVVLAPLVEETLYRGIALSVLEASLRPPAAVALSCVAFGMLHWPGGRWYMLLTGNVAAGCSCALYDLRGGVLAPFAAHLMLNLVEFTYAHSLHRDAP